MHKSFKMFLRSPDGEGEGGAAIVDPPVDPPVETPPVLQDDPAPVDPPKVPWAQRRIDELTFQKHEAQRQAQAKDETIAKQQLEIEALKAGKAPTGVGQAEIEARAAEIAEQRVAVDVFNKQCNDVFTTGAESYSDFKDSIKEFDKLGGLKPEFVACVLEVEAPHKVLYALSKDLDEASRIMALPPLRQVAALQKASIKLGGEAPPITKAPKPPTTVGGLGGGGAGEKNPDEMSMGEWMAWRNKAKKIA